MQTSGCILFFLLLTVHPHHVPYIAHLDAMYLLFVQVFEIFILARGAYLVPSC